MLTVQEENYELQLIHSGSYLLERRFKVLRHNIEG